MKDYLRPVMVGTTVLTLLLVAATEWGRPATGEVGMMKKSAVVTTLTPGEGADATVIRTAGRVVPAPLAPPFLVAQGQAPPQVQPPSPPQKQDDVKMYKLEEPPEEKPQPKTEKAKKAKKAGKYGGQPIRDRKGSPEAP